MSAKEAAERISRAGIAVESVLRIVAPLTQEYIQALQDAAADPEIKAAGIYNIDTAPYRANAAKAMSFTEDAHALYCSNHKQFNVQADEMGIPNPGTDAEFVKSVSAEIQARVNALLEGGR